MRYIHAFRHQLPSISSFPFCHRVGAGSIHWHSSPECMAALIDAFVVVGHTLRTKFQDVHFSNVFHGSDPVLIDLLRLRISVVEDWIPASLFQSTSSALGSTYQPDSALIEL